MDSERFALLGLEKSEQRRVRTALYATLLDTDYCCHDVQLLVGSVARPALGR